MNRHTLFSPIRMAALAVATLIWMPCLHLIYARDASSFAPAVGIGMQARRMAAWQTALWDDPARRRAVVGAMRGTNPEWDFMGRTYFVWSLANMALREPSRAPGYLVTMDSVIADTLAAERAHSFYYFLMPYGQDKPFVEQPEGSQFVDGEIALMLAMRRMVAEKPEYKPLLAARVARMVLRMRASPTLSAESYPDECWTFCNAISLDSMRLEDCLDGTDHSALMGDWVALAKRKLVDRKSGLLVSAYTMKGDPIYGPEGSSIWMVAHSLQIIDPVFASDQYQRAKQQLAASCAGFGYSREWPSSWRGPADVDSGAVVPFADISPGGTGMAFIGASAFDDDAYLRQLLPTLGYGAFPSTDHGGLSYCASNQVGDASVLYAAVLGPMWQKVMRGNHDHAK